MQLMLNGWVNTESQEMKQTVILKMQLILNGDEEEDALYLEYWNNSLVKRWYVDQFSAFKQTTDIISLEIVNTYVDLLCRICI